MKLGRYKEANEMAASLVSAKMYSEEQVQLLKGICYRLSGEERLASEIYARLVPKF
jgi:hypothetical protein